VNDPLKPQHYMSDSELELHQSQENIARENEIRWAWGKLPQVQAHMKFFHNIR